MKKVLLSMAVIGFLIPMVLYPVPIKAGNENKTLQNLYDELSQMERELKDNQNTQKLTESQIGQIQNNLARISDRKVQIEKNIVILNSEIIQMNKDIEAKNEEVKKLMLYLQRVKSNNIYMEYAFGASTMTEFIYRVSIIEQLTKHNDDLIKNMNQAIVDKNKKTKELEQEQIKNEAQKIEFGKEQEKLRGSLTNLVEYQLSIEDEIKEAKKAIDTYRNLGCKLTETLIDCLKSSNNGLLRPVKQGRVTSPYGWRPNPLGSGSSFHAGIDVGGNAVGTPIYAAADGLVVGTGIYDCGGRYVILQHTVRGVPYATRYLHLSKVNVAWGQYVTKETVIGGLGGGESYDQCSTGPHAHFDILKGIFGSRDGSGVVGFREPYSVNPGAANPDLITFPKVGGWFYDRYTKF